MGLIDRARSGANAAKTRADLLRWKSGYHDHRGELYGLSKREIDAIYERRDQELRAEERDRRLKEANEKIEADRKRALGKAQDDQGKKKRAAERAASDLTKAEGAASSAKSARVRAEGDRDRARRGNDTNAIERAEKALVRAQRDEKDANRKAGRARTTSENAERDLKRASDKVREIERQKR